MPGWLLHAVVAWLVETMLVVTPLIGVVWVLERVGATRWDPRLAHAAWLVVLARLLLPTRLLPWPPAVTLASPIETAVFGAASGMPQGPAPAGVAIWLAGALLVSAISVLRAARARRRLEGLPPPASAATFEALAADIGLARMPALHLDPRARAPYVTGLWAPRLIMPADVSTWPAATFEHAVRHELTHLRRRDLWLEAAWMAASALYWFHPLVHVARRRAHEAREVCCDLDVAARIGPAYRDALLQIVARLCDDPLPAHPRHGWHPAIIRLRALERMPATPPRWQRLAAAVFVTGIGAVCVPPHVQVSARPPPAVNLAELVDPRTRLEMGRGSLHVRYALMPMIQADEESRR